MSRRTSGAKGLLNLDSLPDPGPRFQLGERLGSGVTADVYEAQDLQEGNRPVAIKIQRITDDNIEDLEEEYRVLKQYSEHPNLPDFYGTYRKKGRDGDQLWFVMQLCQEGSVIDFVRALHKVNRKLSELHIAFILKEVIKAVLHLHQNHVMHRDIRGSNILITKSGEIKLVDFGLSRELNSTMGKRGTSVGSPSWMAPEVVTSEQKGGATGKDAYDNRVDVWSLGITAIELADGKAPFEDMHPTRALFQIVRNPPPALYRPSNWTQIFNDFIAECLEKNPENRPFMMEMIEHPFFENLPENDSHISQEIKLLVDNVRKHRTQGLPEVLVRTNFLKKDQTSEPEPMFLEDLASMDHVSEDLILEQLQQRLKRGSAYTFVGDVLLFVNPNEHQQIYNEETHAKYFCKSRSANVPHIYSVADCAYQDVLHHEEAQHIILSGESLSGKTANMMHILNHLLYLGKGNVAAAVRVVNGMILIHALGNACTPLNANSTRHVLHTQVTFTTTGKVSGAIFWLYQLERWRVTTDDRRQGNFHLFYYFYDAMTNTKQLDKYKLDTGRRYRYLRSVTGPSGQASNGVSSDPASANDNTRKFEEFRQALTDLEFGDENMETLKNILAAIIILGEVRFRDSGDGKAEIENPRVANSVASLLQVEEKKFSWALVNYCIIEKGQAQKRHQSPEEAEEARDALARAMYSRVVDWIVNFTNMKLSFSRAVFGDRHMVSILDLFGFECFQKNTLEQLMVNSLNEQLQYHYTQRLFAWEMQEREEEDITSAERLTFYNNRPTVDLLMAKPDGIMWLVDEATRTSQGGDFIVEKLKKGKSPFCQFQANEFSVAHYTGKVSYDAKDLPQKNHDFVPPEITETMRLSTNTAIQDLFTHQLSRTGNLTQPPMDVKTAEEAAPADTGKDGKPRRRSKWGAVLVADKQQKSNRSYNTLSRGQFSQTRRMRTATSTFRAVSLEVLRNLNMGGTHFVRCLRAELTGQPRGFQLEVVRQQVRALGIMDTLRARQNGFPFRVPFSEFLRRYKFLAFDFEETVDETADNCRLLMVRLKMEGYAMGKSKVFLKYYNEEYLARLYEHQVKKIVKVQAMMRAFLAKKRVDGAGSKAPGSLAGISEQKPDAAKKKKANAQPKKPVKKATEMTQEEAATVIQKQYRGFQVRKEYKEKLSGDASAYDRATANMMRYFCHRWKAHSMFQVLLLYRAAKQQDLVYFSQQVHLYNQGIMSAVSNSSTQRPSLVQIREMDRTAARKAFGNRPANVWKIPFRFDTIPYMDTSIMCDPVEAGLDALYSDSPHAMQPGDYDTWDAPLRRKKSLVRRNRKYKDQEVQTCSGSNPTSNMDYGPSAAHVQTPFRRELLDTSPLISSKGYAPKAPKQAAPPPPAQKAQTPRRDESPRYNKQGGGGNLVQQQSWMDKSNDNRLPVSSRRNEYDYDNNNRNIDFSPEPGSRPGPRRADVGVGGRPTSHIRELESRGRDINSGSSEDAPFNFQAMLRKTPHNRQSMKRTNIYTTDDADDHSHSSYGAYGGNNYQMPSVGAKKNQWEQQGNEASGGVLRKGPPSYSAAVKGPGSQGQWNDRSQDNWGSERKDYRGGAAGGKSSAFNNKRSSVSFDDDEKRHELVPGFVVEGDVSEL